MSDERMLGLGWCKGRAIAGASVISIALTVACGDDAATATSGDPGGNAGAGAGQATGGQGGAGAGLPSGGGGPGGGGQGGDGAGGGGGGATGGASGVHDPELPGPYAFTELSASTVVAATGHTVPLTITYPTSGPEPGPYPVVVIAHGFQLAPTQYASYASHLASFGYVAVNADYPAGFSPNHLDNAQDLSGALDAAAAHPTVGPLADATQAAMTGHSLGGKLSLHAAKLDTRVRAVVAIDPVDGAMSCSPQDCPDVSDMMPLDIPTAFLGETVDATGTFQACAPAAQNFQTFYANTTAPSVSVNIQGANHMSFIDNLAGCGFVCSFCNPATLDGGTVRTITRAYLAAFFERHVRGNTAYDPYIDGAIATQRYVDPGWVLLDSK